MGTTTFLADENIPFEVILHLREEGVDIFSAIEMMPGAEDDEVLTKAYSQEMVLITMDKGFGELVFKKRSKSSGVVFLRVHPQSVEVILSLLKKVIGMNINFHNSFCVVEHHRVRIIPLSY